MTDVTFAYQEGASVKYGAIRVNFDEDRRTFGGAMVEIDPDYIWPRPR